MHSEPRRSETTGWNSLVSVSAIQDVRPLSRTCSLKRDLKRRIPQRSHDQPHFVLVTRAQTWH
jgi:hypothetical protein